MPYDSKKRSVMAKQLWKLPSYRRKMGKRKPTSFWKGKHLSRSHRDAIAEGCSGRIFSKHHRMLIGEGNSRRIWSEKSRERVGRSLQKTRKERPEILEQAFQKAKFSPNGLERAMMEILDKLHVKYEFQKVVRNFVPDFVLDSLIIEVDGVYWHRDRGRLRKRNRALRRLGYRVVHFTERDVHHDPEHVAGKVRELLEGK